MKDNLKTVLNMEKDYKDLLMVTFTKDFMHTESHQDMVNIIGLMVATLKAHLKED